MQEQQRAELEQLKADNMRLTQALQSQVSQPAAQTPDRSAEMAALQQKINQLQAELQKKPASNDPVDRRLSRDLEQLQAENASLKHAMQILESKKSSGGTKEQAIVTARLQTELQSLKQENMKLKGEVQTLSDRKVAPIAPMPAPVPDQTEIIVSDETTDVVAMITPIERSRPPVRRTIICAIETSTI